MFRIYVLIIPSLIDLLSRSWRDPNFFGYTTTRVCQREAPAFDALSESACVVACVLAGCDYGPQVRGIGIKRALHLVRNSSMEAEWNFDYDDLKTCIQTPDCFRSRRSEAAKFKRNKCRESYNWVNSYGPFLWRRVGETGVWGISPSSS